MKEPITIRKKILSDGRESLYLDIYYKGKRRYEFLKMYLLPNPHHDRLTTERNKATMKAAEIIKAKRIISLQNSAAGLPTSTDKTVQDAYREMIEDRAKSITHSSMITYHNAELSWQRFDKNNIKLKNLTSDIILDYLTWLKTDKAHGGYGLAPVTRRNYYYLLVITLKRAAKKGYINPNPIDDIDRMDIPTAKEPERTFLTIEEVQKIADCKFKHETIKLAFLFSCFTGLRKSDIQSLTWDMIRNDTIVKTIKKTGKVEYIPLSENAKRFLPPRGEGIVFPEMKMYIDQQMIYLAEAANLNRHISFHVARHTFATLALTYGADIYTVSKLLGHSSVSTTQIYAKVIDEKKRAAVALIPTIKGDV